MLYFTFNDAPSGIYSGQVVDVCRYLSGISGKPVRLLALISLRSYWKNRAKIKAQYPRSIVLPMFPKPRNWRKNSFTLRVVRFFTGEREIMARGPFATALALKLKKKGVFRKVIFDARGAYFAELNEYDVVQDAQVKQEIKNIEREVIHGSDRQLVVSQALADYWKKEYDYAGQTHVVIPCTLNSDTRFAQQTEEERSKARQQVGFSPGDIVLAYSGSSSGWQSLEDFGKHVLPRMQAQPALKILLMIPRLPENFAPATQFPDRVKQVWVNAERVGEWLQAADYGWLVREQSVTNRVASPVKFAEYLAAGLQVLISENLGDYSELVAKEQIGYVIAGNDIPGLQPVPAEQREKSRQLAGELFVKSAYRKAYESLLI
ncbi:MAG: glycosyltransferase-like protein [Bacteroidetes bacterium]|nr:MAG: glycosyltransferase-like protein [Bacteroidota bacterium]